MNVHIDRIIASASIALALGGAALGGTALAHAAPHGVDVYAYEVGDDNEDGVIMEDESGWDCTTMGNRTCGVGNSNGVPAGTYDEGGVLITVRSHTYASTDDDA